MYLHSCSQSGLRYLSQNSVLRAIGELLRLFDGWQSEEKTYGVMAMANCLEISAEHVPQKASIA